MQVTETKAEGLTREYKVAVPADEIEGRISARLQDIAQTVRMPGFRPGKVPVSLVRKRYGDSIRGEVLEQAVNESSREAMTERDLRPVGQPRIEVTSFEDGGGLEYKLEVDLMPEIDIPDFSKLEIERLTVEVDEKEIDDAVQRIADMNKGSEPVSTDRKSKSGDVVVIDFVGKIDGEEFAGGKAEGYQLELGSGSFIPGFEDQLVGVKAGEHCEVKVTFPEEYGASELAGKETVFEVDVKELREPKPAAIDDELAKKMGKENLEDLKEALREERRRELEHLSRLRLKRTLLDKLAEKADFDVPSGLLEQEFEAIWQQFEQQREAGQLDEEELAKSEEENKTELREIAERRVRLGLLLSEVGRANEVQISQEDVNRRLFQEAQQYPGQEQAVVEYYRQNPQAMEALTAPLFEDKVIDFILEMAKVTDKAVSMDELMKDPDEEGKKPAKKKAAKSSKASTAKSDAKGAKASTSKRSSGDKGAAEKTGAKGKSDTKTKKTAAKDS